MRRKVMDSFSRRVAAKMCSCISRQSRERALALSMRGRPWSTKKPRIGARRQPRISGFSAELSRRTPADHCGFYAPVSGHALPRAVVPSAQERDDIRTCVIFAKDLQRLIGRRRSSMIEVVDAFLPGDHGESLSLEEGSETGRD